MRYFIICVFTMFLASCGGDSSSSNPTPPPPPASTNNAPVANAGGDISQNIGATAIMLDGSDSSDSDGDALTYAWTISSQPAGATVNLENSDTVSADFVASTPGNYEIQLTVTDPSGASDTDTIMIELINLAPTANAGLDISQGYTTNTILLNGSGSTDPENQTLTFSWTITAQPIGVTANIDNAETDMAEFSASDLGVYEIDLVVTDPYGESNRDSMTIELIEHTITAVIDPYETTANLGADFSLHASNSTDSNGHALTFSWEIFEFPSETTMQLIYSGASPTIQFDAPGEFNIRLTASDGDLSDSVETGAISVDEFTITSLANGFSDAEFNKATESITTIDGTNFTHIDAEGTISEISLPLAAAAVSISPSGNSAVVGHDAWVTHIDLGSNVTLNNYSVPVNIYDIVASSDDYAHAIPAVGQWINMTDINLTNGSNSDGAFGRHRTRIKLHPSGQKIYGTDTDSSPSDIERFNIADGVTTAAYDSPYHGDYPICGDLWMGPNESSVLTKCHVVLRTTENRDTDLRYISQLNRTSRVDHADSSAFNARWYVLNSDDATNIQVYNAEDNTFIDSIQLPDNETTSNPWIGKYVFASDFSGAIFILAQDTEASPSEYVLIQRGFSDATNSDIPPTIVAQKYSSGRTFQTVTVDASNSFDPEGAELSYAWTLISEPLGSSVTLSGTNTDMVMLTPQIAGVYELELIVNDGSRSSAPKTVFVYAFDNDQSLVHRLEGGITDMEYSTQLNSAVYISDVDSSLNILSLNDFSLQQVDIVQTAYRVAVSPNGQFAAVSHAGSASLIDLNTAVVIDTQTYDADWGDIVLDNNQNAHIIPNRDQWVDFYSIDFSGDTVYSRFGARAGTTIRMNPANDWVYGITTGLSPQDHDKWDVTTLPGQNYSDPYHGAYSFGSNIWISEDGTRIMAQNGNTFHSSSDTSEDMYYAGKIQSNISLNWGSHDSLTNNWAVIASEFSSDTALRNKLLLLDDRFLGLQSQYDIAETPTASSTVNGEGTHVFMAANGGMAYVVTEAESLIDSSAIQAIDINP